MSTFQIPPIALQTLQMRPMTPLQTSLLNPSVAPDYDMDAYVAKYGKPDQSKGQHLTDEFKLPNHMTFSTDSMYSTDAQKGGEWKQDGGKWHFYASPLNLQMHTPQELQDYFKRVEPDSVLHLPSQAMLSPEAAAAIRNQVNAIFGGK